MIDRRRSVKTDLGQTSDYCSEGGSRRVSASGHRRSARFQHSYAAAAALFVGVVGMLGMARAYEAPTFMDYRANGTYSPCELAGGCRVIANVETTVKFPSLLPFVNPPDGHVFYGRVGDDIDFYVAGQQGRGLMAKTLSILFEEDASLMSGGAFEYTKPTAGQTVSVIDKAHFRVYDDAKPVYASYNPITRYYSLTVKKFVPSKYLTMCFRILMDCPFPWLPCPAEDPAAPCGVGVALSTCANCCFKTPAQHPPPPSALWGGREAGPNGNSDASTSPERSCYLDKEGRCLNSRFYPRRCVRMYVAEAPQIVSVLPVDHSMVLGAVAVKRHAKDWLRNSTAANVHVRTGQILRLNIDAMDPNEEDDIDIRPDAGVSLPAGAAMGARMCCNSEYEQCKELPFASQSCSRVCTWNCGSEYPTHHTNTTLESACVEECADQCVRNSCRFVRRQLRMQPTPELIAQRPGAFTGLKFVAFDDSGRLASRKVGVCCAAADLQSQWEFVGTPLAAGDETHTHTNARAHTRLHTHMQHVMRTRKKTHTRAVRARKQDIRAQHALENKTRVWLLYRLCVCVCVFMRIPECAHVYTNMRVCVRMCTRTCIHTLTAYAQNCCAHVCICILCIQLNTDMLYIYTYVRTFTNVYLCIHDFKFVSLQTQTHTHAHSHTRMHSTHTRIYRILDGSAQMHI